MNEKRYLKQWLNRCAVLFVLRRRGARHILPKTYRVKDLLDLNFPDEKNIVLPLLSLPGQSPQQVLYSSLKTALSNLGYCGRVELFNMWACIFDDAEYLQVVRSKPPFWIDKHVLAFTRWAESYRLREGIWPHPRLIVDAHAHLD